ncbi:MAG: DUF5668 domain-containing protein [Anaerolineales bacterium]
MNRPHRRGGLVGPICLVGLGLILLLNNLGILSYSIWALLLEIWPVLLVAIGIDLLVGRHSAWGTLLAFVLIVALIGGAVWLVAIEQPAGEPVAGETVTQPLTQANAAEVTLIPAVGSIHLGSFSSSSLLLEGTFHPLAGDQIVHSFATEGETEVATIRSTGISLGPVVRPGSLYSWDVHLNDQVPTGLHMQFGIGEVDLNLTNLRLTNLDLSAGMGQFAVYLPSQGRFPAKISGGIGQVLVSIPPGMEARIHVSTALAGRSISTRFRPEGDYFVSSGYATGENRVDLDLTMAFGSLVIR